LYSDDSVEGSIAMKIDFGCGQRKKDGYVGVDSLSFPGVDVVHDLNIFPYPFDDSAADDIWMDNVLEHLDQPLKVMEEIFRISRNGGRVVVGVPYFRSFYAIIDPTHKNYFGVWWFNYFDPSHPFHCRYGYTKAQFRLNRLEFDREFKNGTMHLHHKLLLWLAEKYPCSYEARISHLFPLSSLTYYLTSVK
jgi:SAM-dependent methyltransferase